MKYKLTYHPNPECLTVNVSVELTNKMIESFYSINDVSGKHKKFAEEIFEIDGISSVSLYKYKLLLMKGSVFEWEDIIPDAIKTILLHYCPNEKATEIEKPVQEIIDEKGYSQSHTMEEKETHKYSLPTVGELIK